MNLFFWNLNFPFDQSITNWISRVCRDVNPDILCFAEGVGSKEECAELVRQVETFGYECYYNPLFYEREVMEESFGWDKFGLKVFVKDANILKTEFGLSQQKLNGRIIY